MNTQQWIIERATGTSEILSTELQELCSKCNAVEWIVAFGILEDARKLQTRIEALASGMQSVSEEKD